MIDSIFWRLSWNEEFQNDKDKIQYAVSKDANEIYYVSSNIKEDKQFMLELLETNPNCYFGMTQAIKADEDVAKFIIHKDWRQFVSFADGSLKNEDFLKKCNLPDEDIKMLLKAINDFHKDKQINNLHDNIQKTTTSVFDPEAYNCSNFLTELNKCKNAPEVKAFIDTIVNSFQYPKNTPKMIGSSSSQLFLNNGIYDNFINPQIAICPQVIISNGFRYHIYDNEYLYDFAIGIRKMNLSANANLLPMVMKFLDSYFGFPKNSEDMREDTLYNWALNHAEDFLKKQHIPIKPEFDAIDQIQIGGYYPISALKGTFSAQCTERGTLAQNILKICGLRSFVMFGECESRNATDGHCWNAIADSNGNLLLIDYSNTVYSYKNGKFFKREPYSYVVNHADYLAHDGFLEFPDYHYEDGKRVADNGTRKYAIGKQLSSVYDLEAGNALK